LPTEAGILQQGPSGGKGGAGVVFRRSESAPALGARLGPDRSSKEQFDAIKAAIDGDIGRIQSMWYRSYRPRNVSHTNANVPGDYMWLSEALEVICALYVHIW
jgi:hypothetical protein